MKKHYRIPDLPDESGSNENSYMGGETKTKGGTKSRVTTGQNYTPFERN